MGFDEGALSLGSNNGKIENCSTIPSWFHNLTPTQHDSLANSHVRTLRTAVRRSMLVHVPPQPEARMKSRLLAIDVSQGLLDG
jgi:hypothetical protein